MKYNGKELIEMYPQKWVQKWDGKPREMLAWNCENDTPVKTRIVDWYKNEHGHVIWRDDWRDSVCKYWNNVAEIPEEESDTQKKEIVPEYSLNDCINSLKYHFKSKNEDSPDDEIAFPSLKESYKSIIKYLDELKSVKEENSVLNAKLEAFGELHKVAEFVQTKILEYKSENKPVKKLRRMTYKELDEWLEQGKGVVRIADNVSYKISYDCEDRNKEVNDAYKICGWAEDTWHEPMVEE